MYAIGQPLDGDAWKIAIEYPRIDTVRNSSESQLLAAIPLRDEALSVSAVWGRSFEDKGKRLGHVIDPRTGEPVDHALLSAVVLPSATETDALSTALLVRGESGLDQVQSVRPQARALLLRTSQSGFEVLSRGIAFEPFGT